MPGEKAVAVGLSLAFHACVAWAVLMRLAATPGPLPGLGPSVRVSMDAFVRVDTPASAATAETIRSSGDIAAAVAAAAPPAIVPAASVAPLPAVAEDQALREVGAAEAAPPQASEPAAASTPEAPALAPISPPDATVAAPPDMQPMPIAADPPMGPSGLAGAPVPAAPPLRPRRDTPGATLSEQVAPAAPLAGAGPAAEAPPAIAPAALLPMVGEEQALKGPAVAEAPRTSASELAAATTEAPPDLAPISPPAATAAAPPDTQAMPLAADPPTGPSGLAGAPVPAAPPLRPSSDARGETLSEQGAPAARPAGAGPAEPVAPSRPPLVSAVPSPALAEAPVPDLPAAASLADPTVEAARPATASPAAPPSPAPAPMRPQALPDAAPPLSLPAAGGGEATEAPGPVPAPKPAVSASLSPAEQGTALDLDLPVDPGPAADAARARQVRAFLDHYDGGPCFFAAARRVSSASAEIESFATTAETFRTLDRALQASTGIEPTIAGQRVWSAQCPAVESLRRLPEAEGGPSLDLPRRDLDRGDTLTGTVGGTDGRPLHLFVISETGALTDISGALSDRNGTTTFAFKPPSSASGGPFPQILVLVAGPLPTLPHSPTVGDLFEPLIQDTAVYAVATKMFLVRR